MNKLIFYLLVSIMVQMGVLQNAACMSERKKITSLSELTESKDIYSEKNKWGNCRIIFSSDYGLNEIEFSTLEYLTLHGDAVKDDIECNTLVGLDALKQILHLAVSGNNDRAISYILFDYDSIYFLDGEYAETYGENYIIPVIMSLNDIDSLVKNVDLNKSNMLAKEIAYTLMSPFSDIDVSSDVFLDDIKNRNGDELAKLIQNELNKINK